MRKQGLVQEVRIEHDFELYHVVEALNWVLAEYGLELDDDGEEHEGFCILILKEVG